MTNDNIDDLDEVIDLLKDLNRMRKKRKGFIRRIRDKIRR